jgi:hypothetical protein
MIRRDLDQGPLPRLVIGVTMIDRACPEDGRCASIRVAHHAGRFGETGPLDFAIRWDLGAGGLFLSAQESEDMTEPRT